MDKALELFSKSGYDAVSVAQIAEAVGIKAPSLYNHYPSKQAIFDAIVSYTTELYEKRTDEIAIHIQNSLLDVGLFSEATGDLIIEKLHQIFDYSMHNNTISRFRRMMTIEQFRSPQFSKMYSERYVERIVDYHAGIFKSLIAAGKIASENPYELAAMYAMPIITIIGICDRQPEREAECLKKIDDHVRLFYKTFNCGKD